MGDGDATIGARANTQVDAERQQDVLEVRVRQVRADDHVKIVKLFQAFDSEKYSSTSLENNNSSSSSAVEATSVAAPKHKASLSLAGLRIDERGGIYLNPLLDANNAYFKCYVAQEMSSRELIGYVLFFNTLQSAADDRGAQQKGGAGVRSDDPVAVVEDLFVRPNFRCRGVASQLIKRVLKSSLDRGCVWCECLLLPGCEDGLHFWRRRAGAAAVDEAVDWQRRRRQQQQQQQLRRPHESAPSDTILVLPRHSMDDIFKRLSGAAAGDEESAQTSSEKENDHTI